MRLRSILCLGLAALLGGVVAAPAAATSYDSSEFPGFAAAFRLEGSNGYSIRVNAYSEPGEGERIFISAIRRGSAAFYAAPVLMTATTIRADLGSLGKVDLILNPSGRQRTIRLPCSRGSTFSYEPGTYEGVLEFKGEEGYTTVRVTQVPLRPLIDPSTFCGGGAGSGEATGPGIPGARLRGSSYAHGRALSFQVNKNRPRAVTVFEASLRERHDGISIQREVQGAAKGGAFRFQPDLATAVLSPPEPFSGSASLSHSPDSVNPIWSGGLVLDFPGRSNVPLAGPTFHVSLVHARFNCSDGGEAEIYARPRCGF